MFSSFYVGNYQPFTMLYYALVYKLGAGDAFYFISVIFSSMR
ncbi:hypothetical protein EMGBS15_04880 [Filimonas sp.]|nr:hypothetical protein EMGBS15_04880 [Filimonas sp.]